MKTADDDIWTTATHPRLATQTAPSLPAVILPHIAVDPADEVSAAWLRAKPAVLSFLSTAGVVGLTALLMVALPLVAMALVLLRFVIVAAAAAAFVVGLGLYGTSADFRSWVRTRVTTLLEDPA